MIAKIFPCRPVPIQWSRRVGWTRPARTVVAQRLVRIYRLTVRPIARVHRLAFVEGRTLLEVSSRAPARVVEL